MTDNIAQEYCFEIFSNKTPDYLAQPKSAFGLVFGSNVRLLPHGLSSPCVKRAGPKGLRAESARAVTGRRCPHSGAGEDFLTGQQGFFFMKTAVTLEWKVKTTVPKVGNELGFPLCG